MNFDFSNLAQAIGLLAQLVERLNGIEEVNGSNPLGSTILGREFARIPGLFCAPIPQSNHPTRIILPCGCT